MSVNIDEDTEFNDALRKHGIIPPRASTPPPPPPPLSPTLDDLLDDFTSSEIQEIGEDAQDDEAERTIAAYRQRRVAEDKKEDKRARFGRVYPIGREDYTREVTEASKVNEEDDNDEQGTGVVCFLYKDGTQIYISIPHSDRTAQQVNQLATRYPRTKFISIVGNKCIPDLPDTRIPMLIVYKKGDIRNQVVAWGADRERRIEELEALLMVAGALHLPEHRRPGEARDRYDKSSDEDDDMRSSANGKNIRGNSNKDDSDFEFDL